MNGNLFFVFTQILNCRLDFKNIYNEKNQLHNDMLLWQEGLSHAEN